MRFLIAADMCSASPDNNVCFDIYTDMSDHQMDTCIMQDGHTIAYYIKNLNSAQKIDNKQEQDIVYHGNS